MPAPPRSARPQAVLFVCGMNSVRSPMAAALLRQMAGEGIAVASAGVRKDILDPFAMAAMLEAGIDITQHEPTTIDVDTARRLFTLICVLHWKG